MNLKAVSPLSVPREKKKKEKKMEKKKLSRAVPKGAPILCSMKFCTGFAEIEMAGKKKNNNHHFLN